MTGKLLAYHLKSPRVPQFENHWYRAMVTNLGYICLSERVHLRLAVKGKNISVYYLFLNVRISANIIF